MTDDQTRPDSRRMFKEHWQVVATMVLLLGFAALVFVLMVTASGASEIVWQRRVYVFGGVEALVFAALGWLFGREVSRSAVATAQKDTAEAKKEAQVARGEAQQQSVEAAKARVEAAEERTRGETTAAVVENMIPAGEVDSPAGGSSDAGLGGPDRAQAPATAVDLQALFRTLYPRRTSSDG